MKLRVAFAISCMLVPTLILSVSSEAKTQPVIAGNDSYGNLPLSFEVNEGQADRSIQFVSHGQGYTLFLRPADALLTLTSSGTAAGNSLSSKGPVAQSAQTSVLHLSLRGANSTAPATREDQQITRTNYFLGNDPARWHTGIANYGRVRYTGIYPGIDLVYYGNQRRLEHDFVVAPNADPARITLAFDGVETLAIEHSTGDLIIKTSQGDIRLLKPISYQESEGRRSEIPSAYKLLAHRRVSFAIGRYDHSRPLIIDPVLVYSTYLGGSGGDAGSGIAVDSSGNAYVTGYTGSIDFPVTASAFQSQNFSVLAGHGSAAFVTKLNAAGTALIYSTYLGGTGGNYGRGIAVDSTGNAYVTGITLSSDFPVTCGAFQTTRNSTSQNSITPFVTKLNAAGDGLTYSTYLGAKDIPPSGYGDATQAIAVNAAGNAFVTGYTNSSSFPTTAGAFQTTFAGNSNGYTSNAFVTELNQTGTGLQYSTYLGGSAASGTVGDIGNAIAIDASGDAFISGSTTSANFPVTEGALQTSLHGSTNAFVTKMNPTGTKALYSTYLGGSSGDTAQAIAVDSSGFAYVAGNTNSSDFPTTSGVLETSSDWDNSPPQAFVAKLNQGGTALEYSTYLEGQQTTVNGLAVDTSGTAYVTGSAPTANPGIFGNFMQTPDALATPSGSSDVFLVKLNPSATALNYATLLGGGTGAGALALDASGNVYLTGIAFAADLPTSSGAFQTTNHAIASQLSNAFVTKFALAAETNDTTYPTRTSFPISTTIGTDGAITNVQCGAAPDGGSLYDIFFEWALQANAPGPLMTGTVNFDGTPIPGPFNAYPDVNGQQFFYNMNEGPASGPITMYLSATYSGDSNYAPASASFTISDPGCPASSSSLRTGTTPQAAAPRSFRPQFKLDRQHESPLSTSRANLPAIGPKFSAPAPVRSDRQSALSAQSQEVPCIGQHLPLKVTLHNIARRYGAANPTFTYTITGLVNGDTMIVTPKTSATQSSPVGTYPITASVSGADAADYSITVQDATLTIVKAPLYISAKNVAVTYGSPLAPPSLYAISGFVNGDTASVVSGAPVLSTTVTSTTPVGFYPIGVQVGTLTAANYYFDTFSNGEGSVEVFKARLAIRPASFTIHVGDPLPTFTYTITGFVNGETQASATTGAPALTTTAPSTAKPGRFYIIGTVGTLKAQNYVFAQPRAATNGILTILP